MNELPPSFSDEFVSLVNSSTANLASGASFTGTGENVVDSDIVSITFKADQPVTIQVQQSGNGTNWDVTDSYTVAASTGDARSFELLGSFLRLIVTNNGVSTTTGLRLQSIYSPGGDVVPRALTQLGNFKTAILESVPIGVSGITAVSGNVRIQDVSGNGFTSTNVSGHTALDIHQVDQSFIISGFTPVGQTPGLNPVSIAGVDGSGLKRAILTDVSGAVAVDTRDGFGVPIGSQLVSGASGVSGNYLQVVLAASGIPRNPVPPRAVMVGGQDVSGNLQALKTDVSGAAFVNPIPWANVTTSGSIAANGQAVVLPSHGLSSAVVVISGTWSGNLQIQGSADGSTYSNLLTSAGVSGTYTANPISANGHYKVVRVAPYSQIQLLATSWVSGSASIFIDGSVGQATLESVSINPLNMQVSISDVSGFGITSTSVSGHQRLDAILPSEGPNQPGTIAAKSLLIAGQYKTTAPVASDGQMLPLQLDQNGRLATSSVTISPLPAFSFNNQNSLNAGVTIYSTFTATAKAAIAQFYAGGTGIGKQALYSSVSGSTQSVSGGDFENAGDVGTTWIWASTAGTGSVAQSTTQAFTGTHSCQLTFSNSSGNNSQTVKQTFSTSLDFSMWRYVTAEFFNTLSSGGNYTRTISIILTDSSANTRTYSVSGLSTATPFNASNWIRIQGEISNPTSSTGTGFDATSIASIQLNMNDSGNKSGIVYWDTVRLEYSIVPIIPIYHQANTSFNTALNPVFVLNIGDQITIAQTNNDTVRKEFFALAGGVSL